MSEFQPVEPGDTRTRRTVPRDHTIELRIKAPEGQLSVQPLYREDVLAIHGHRYLVLNFGVVEVNAPGTAPHPETGDLMQIAMWVPTRKIVIEMQAISEDGTGLAEPTMIERNGVFPDPPRKPGENFQMTTQFDETIIGASIEPCSPRRPRCAACNAELPFEGATSCQACHRSDADE